MLLGRDSTSLNMVRPVAVNPDMLSNHASIGDKYPDRKYGNPPNMDINNQPRAAILKDSLSVNFSGGLSFIYMLQMNMIHMAGNMKDRTSTGFLSTIRA